MIGRLLCAVGLHKWIPDGPVRIVRRSKYDVTEHARGKCERGCGATADDVSRESEWY